MLLFEQLQREGFAGGYDSVRRYVKKWREQGKGSRSRPLSRCPLLPARRSSSTGAMNRSNWVDVMSRSRWPTSASATVAMPFCIAYMRETLEMVLDAHVQAFEFFGGACRKGIYDNLKTVVSKVLMGKDRIFNRRFQESGLPLPVRAGGLYPGGRLGEGAGRERQVGVVRQTPVCQAPQVCRSGRIEPVAAGRVPDHGCQPANILSSKSKPLPRLLPRSKRHSGPTCRSCLTAYQESTGQGLARPRWSTLTATATASMPSAVGKTVTVRAYADRIVVRPGRQAGWAASSPVSAGTRQSMIRGTISMSLKQKPGALRNGAPFKEWDLPEALAEVRERLSRTP